MAHKLSGKCAMEGSMDPPAVRIVIHFDKINRMEHNRIHQLERLKDYTIDSYVGFFLDSAGMEHYSLLNYMSSTYDDCRHFMYIGTGYVASALAAGSNQRSPVWTFDLPTSSKRLDAFRGKTEEEWQKQVQEAGVNIEFYNLDVMQVSDEELKKYLGTWFASENFVKGTWFVM